ncbi:MAG: formate C-acetyltransferase/glycerol dehydratase family glycyl radical enzyme, partial [bacterium]|nr:formate C-acetyltransferase/glycerol dehydratase family glycyl radical enzyme [bacterium]
MNERIRKLREQSLQAVPALSLERARLLTEFYQSGVPERVSIPVARALAFRHLLEHKRLCINPGELIVGERGPSPKATPTYPEICTHSLDDFEILDSREKVPFKADDEVRQIQKETIIPFWKGRSIRDRIFEEVDDEWKDAYEAGVFTEFQEQRAPGHTVLDDKIYHKGFVDFKVDIENAIVALDFIEDDAALEKREQLKGMTVAVEALMAYARRFAEELSAQASKEPDQDRKSELDKMAGICAKVPERAPETFWEALQYYWFVHLGVITELNTWDSFNPGRLDQHLWPFYQRDIEAGRLTEESARELLQAFWVK